MIKKAVYLEPSSSSRHFFICTDEASVVRVTSEALYYNDLDRSRVYLGDNLLAIGTKSDILKVPIYFELLDSEPVSDKYKDKKCVKTAISAVRIENGLIRLFDPPAGEFAKFEVPNGDYILKVNFYDNDSAQEGISSDSYLIQMWPHMSKLR